ncbi:DMT family transporter [Acidaminococcus timonensis]|uniref:DMT family transporter n=1 Tax=Acidaminococcus timonensis TaxID=1871002 RepID=UPI0008DAD12F|nr:DMT family transporter [Acidaminococcus timonensis]
MEKAKGNLLLLLTALIWGSAFVAQSVGMDYIGPFTFSAVRNLIAILVLIPVVWVFGCPREEKNRLTPCERLKPDPVTLKAGVLCGIWMGIASILQQVGMVMTTAGKAGFITALYIILVPILGRFLGRPVRKIMLLCVPMALVGFYLLCVKGGFSISFGDFLIFLCAIFFAGQILTIDHFLLLGASSVKLAWVQFAVTFVISAVLTVLFEKPVWEALWEARWALLYTGMLSSGVAYTLQIVGQKYTEPTTATLIMSLESVFAALSGWLLLGETMTGKELTGCVLVFVAVLLAQIPIKKRT